MSCNFEGRALPGGLSTVANMEFLHRRFENNWLDLQGVDISPEFWREIEEYVLEQEPRKHGLKYIILKYTSLSPEDISPQIRQKFRVYFHEPGYD